GLPSGAPRGRLPRARRLRARRLPGHRPPAGEPARVLDLDRRPHPHARHRARAGPRAPEAGLTRPVRWLLPLAAIPVLALLAYGGPETSFVARDGRIRAKHVGALTDEVVRAKLAPLL